MNKRKTCRSLPASSGAPQASLKSHVASSIPSRLRSTHNTKGIKLCRSKPVENHRSQCNSSSIMDGICDASYKADACPGIHHTGVRVSPLNRQNSKCDSLRDTLNQLCMKTCDRSSINDFNNPVCVSSRNFKSNQHSSDHLDSSNSMFCRYSSSSSCASMCYRTCNGIPQSIFSTSSDENEEDSMFIPEPIIQLSSRLKKPSMPYHTIEELTPGKHVWVVDEEDVEMFIPSTWCNAYRMVCNGRLYGTVVRHNGSMTLVRFHDKASEMSLSLTLPRPCLSTKPVEPYENSQSVEKGVFGSCYCEARSRMTYPDSVSLEDSHFQTHHQFYETLSVLGVPAERHKDLGESQQCFQRGEYAAALELVNRRLAAQSPGKPPDVDALALRSRVLVFLGRPRDALADAVCCAEMEPRWVRGYLCMARAHSGLGNFNEAAAALRKVSALLPNSAELECIKNLNSYMIRVQKLLQEVSNGTLSVTLDSMYCKRIIIQSESITANQLLCLECAPILAMPSLFGNRFVGRCEVCFRDGGEEMDAASVNTFASVQTNYTSSPISEFRFENDAASHNCSEPLETASNTPLKSSGIFCSEYCQKRGTLFSRLEEKHREGLKHVKKLLYSKVPHIKDTKTLEMMNMTTRLFFMVISTHRRLIYYQRNRCKNKNGGTEVASPRKAEDFLKSRGIAKASSIFLDRFSDKTHTGIENLVGNPSTDSDAESRAAVRGPNPKVIPIELSLMLLGVYPLVNDSLNDSQRAELIALYKVLTVKFKAESKNLYTETLFCSLYNYISFYFTPVYAFPSSTRVSPTMIQVFGKDGEIVSMPYSLANIYYVYYLPLLLGCAVRESAPLQTLVTPRTDKVGGEEEDATLKRDRCVHNKSPSLSLLSPESSANVNAKVRFVGSRRSLFYSPRCISRFTSVQTNLASLVAPASGEEGTWASALEPLFPLLEVIALRAIRRQEFLTYLSMPQIEEIH